MNTLAIHAIFATLLCFIQHGISLDFFVMRKYSEISTDYGKSAVLNCSSNSPYEYCTLIHDTDICQMEYKSRKNQVKLINCDFLARMKLIGNLSNHECAIELQNVSGKDAGVWKCIMEEYKFGYVKGDTDTGEIHLVVNGIPPKVPATTSEMESTLSIFSKETGIPLLPLILTFAGAALLLLLLGFYSYHWRKQHQNSEHELTNLSQRTRTLSYSYEVEE